MCFIYKVCNRVFQLVATNRLMGHHDMDHLSLKGGWVRLGATQSPRMVTSHFEQPP